MAVLVKSAGARAAQAHTAGGRADGTHAQRFHWCDSGDRWLRALLDAIEAGFQIDVAMPVKAEA